MPDIQFGGESLQVDIEHDPWEAPLQPEFAALIGKPLPEVRLPSTEAPSVPLPLHQLSRARNMLITLPQISTSKHPLPEHLADHPSVLAGAQLQQSVLEEYENLASLGFCYIFLVTTQSVEELRQIIRPEPRQGFPGLSDPDLELAKLLHLPTFAVDGKEYYEPFSLILREGIVEKIAYPIASPAQHCLQVFHWVRAQRPDLDFLYYNIDRGTFTPKKK